VASSYQFSLTKLALLPAGFTGFFTLQKFLL